MTAQTEHKSAFDLQPYLKGDLLELRPLRLPDFDGLYAAASDPLIWAQHPESDRYTRDVFQRYFDSAIDSKGAFVIIDRKSGRIVGSSRYWDFDPAAREVEIGWTFLERAYWGGEYNRELKKLMLDHAFKYVDRVLFIIGENNIRSQKAIEKIGAKFVGKIERPDRNGNMTPNSVFAINREAVT